MRLGSSPSSLLTWLLLPVAAAMLVGCPQRTEPPDQLPHAPTNDEDPDPSSSGEVTWPFWPVTMRLHPLTRLTRDEQTGEPIIECRLEFQDSEGQTSKAIGRVTLQIYPDSAAATGSGSLETWNQNLSDLQVNRRQYDDVTRTYLFRLQTMQPLPAGCELRVFFLSADGRRMSAEMRLRQ